MISFLFSSRRKDNSDHNLLGLLQSFLHFTTPEERSQCEFLIKFDEDDDEVQNEIKKFFEKGDLDFVVKTFTWARNGGRNSLHEVQSLLYGYINPQSTWIHVIADDFVFIRSNFVTDILNSDNNFTLIGIEDRGYDLAPCFSRKLLDACCGYFGTQPNGDGFSSGIRTTLLKKYDIDIGLEIKRYYSRSSSNSGEDWEDNHNKIMKNFDMLNRIYQLISKNIFLCMKDSKNDQSIHLYKPDVYPDSMKHKGSL